MVEVRRPLSAKKQTDQNGGRYPKQLPRDSTKTQRKSREVRSFQAVGAILISLYVPTKAARRQHPTKLARLSSQGPSAVGPERLSVPECPANSEQRLWSKKRMWRQRQGCPDFRGQAQRQFQDQAAVEKPNSKIRDGRGLSGKVLRVGSRQSFNSQACCVLREKWQTCPAWWTRPSSLYAGDFSRMLISLCRLLISLRDSAAGRMARGHRSIRQKDSWTVTEVEADWTGFLLRFEGHQHHFIVRKHVLAACLTGPPGPGSKPARQVCLRGCSASKPGLRWTLAGLR